MRIRCLAIGRSRDRLIAELVERYRARCPWTIEIVELDLKKQLDRARRIEAEGELLLAGIERDERVIVLDERGRGLSSEAFAETLGAWRDQGMADVACLIGGADGLAPRVRERADLVLALGALTWPHELVRVLLVEQLYRASAILSGHPYHRA